MLEFKPEFLKNKALKIAPHIIDSLLLISGITLFIQGQWLNAEYGWILTKLFILLFYIGFGVMVMRTHGLKRYLALIGAISCYGYIFLVAITKQGLF